jgi:hypothetical protein
MRTVDAQRAEVPLPVFPVDPDDVPAEAVTAVRRTLLRQRDIDPGDPADGDDLARLIVAVVIAALAKQPQEPPASR